VAQRRRRVFVVGYLGDWRPAAAVLFERQSLSGHPKPSREAGQRVAPTVVQGPPYSRTGNERVECEAIVVQPIPFDTTQITSSLNYSRPESGDPCHPLAAGAHPPAIAQPIAFTRCDYGNDAVVDGTPTMRCGSNYSAHLAIAQSMAVRRLTPVECERLQGFPDNYTEIPWRGKAETPDGPRYKALGNSMAVPVMRWIGQRIQGR
jgi:DNA (cytosine-5)-methyltransferase 1